MKKLLALLFVLSSGVMFANCGCGCHNTPKPCSSCENNACCKEAPKADDKAQADEKCPAAHPKPIQQPKPTQNK